MDAVCLLLSIATIIIVSVRPIPFSRLTSLPSKRILVVPGGTMKVGTGSGMPGLFSPFRLPFDLTEGTTRGLLVGVGDGAGVLVGVAVREGGISGKISATATGVSCFTGFGVLVAGSALVGSLVAGGLEAVSEGSWATAEAMTVRLGSIVGEIELA
jgi:hypothetical protein